MTHTFDRIILAAIIANTTVLITSFIDHSHENVWEPIHTGFLMFFVTELGVRLAGAGWHPIRFLTASRWNAFDTAVIGLAFLPALGVDVTLLRVARLARVVHSLRHVGHLRLADLVRRKTAT